MPSSRKTGASLLVIALLGAGGAADTVTLTNGHVIEADRAWFEGNEVRYEKNGGIYGVPKTMVVRVDSHSSPARSPGSWAVAARAPA